MPRRFKHWAYLNEDGKRDFGDAFPNGEVPVLSMIPTFGPLGDIDNKPEHYFMVYFGELTGEQITLICKKLADRFGVEITTIKEQITELGLPLRQSLTSGSGTNHPGFFR